MESDTSTLEEKEAMLTDACVRHLSQANHQVAGLQEELCAKTEVMVKQQDDIKNLMAKVISLETQLKKVGGATVLRSSLSSLCGFWVSSCQINGCFAIFSSDLSETWQVCRHLLYQRK